MNFLNALTSAYFKTAPDGSIVFYPWSLWVRGYTLASEQDRQRLQRQLKIYLTVGFVLILLAMNMVSTLASFEIAGAISAFYVLWMLYEIRHFSRSSEKLSVDESLTVQARAYNIVVLWLLLLLSIVAFGASIVVLVVKPGDWFVALTGIAFFGLILAKAIRMLVLRYGVVEHP